MRRFKKFADTLSFVQLSRIERIFNGRKVSITREANIIKLNFVKSEHYKLFAKR